MIRVMNAKVVLRTKHRTFHFEIPSLTVDDGEVCTLTGLNGTGKTSVLRLISGAISSETGQVSVSPSMLAVTDIDRQLHHRLHAVDNFHRLSAIFGLPWLADSKIKVSLDQVGLRGLGKQRIGSFSKGQKVRVILALIMAHRPKAIILDEPTNGLDHEGRSIFYSIVSECREDGASIIISTHDVDLIREISSKSYVMINDQGHHKCHIAESAPELQFKIELKSGDTVYCSQRNVVTYLHENSANIVEITANGLM